MARLNFLSSIKNLGSVFKKRTSTSCEAGNPAGRKTKEAFNRSPLFTGSVLALGLGGIGALSYMGYRSSDPGTLEMFGSGQNGSGSVPQFPGPPGASGYYPGWRPGYY